MTTVKGILFSVGKMLPSQGLSQSTTFLVLKTGEVISPVFQWIGECSQIPSNINQTLNSLNGLAQKLEEKVDNPAPFVHEVVGAGIHAAMYRDKKGKEKKRDDDDFDLEEMTEISWFSGIQAILLQGAGKSAAYVLIQLLNLSETHYLEGKDQVNLKRKSIRKIEKAWEGKGNLYETVCSVWKSLRQYNILIIGFPLSSMPFFGRSSSFPDDEGNAHLDGTLPLGILEKCKGVYKSLRRDFQLPTTASPLSKEHKTKRRQTLGPEKETPETETNQIIEDFCSNALHYLTMNIVDSMFGSKNEHSDYNTYLQSPDSQKAYLDQFESSTKHFFAKIAYEITLWFIRPLIEETIKEAVTALRGSLTQDDLFLEQKLKEFSNYFGQVRNAASKFVKEQPVNSGRLEDFLERNLNAFGDEELSKEELIHRFEELIIEEYLPESKVSIYGYRIFLFSSLAEWIMSSLRKKAVKHFLTKTNLLTEMLNKKDTAVYSLQLTLRKNVEEKIDQLRKLIEESTLEKDAASPTFEEEVHNMTHMLHAPIREFSENLLTFLKLEANKGSFIKLQEMQNQMNSTFTSFLRYAAGFLEIQIPSLQEKLITAMTHIIKTIFVAFLKEKESRAENHIQYFFTFLNQVFTTTEPVDEEIDYEEEVRRVDQSIDDKLAELIYSALKATLDDKIKKSISERHETIAASVENELRVSSKFAKKINITKRIFEYLDCKNASVEIQLRLGQLTDLILNHLDHISAYLNKKELRSIYYPETSGDVHNASFLIIEELTNLADSIRQIANNNRLLAKTEELVAQGEAMLLLLNQLTLPQNKEEFLQTIELINEVIPEEGGHEIHILLGQLRELRNQLSTLRKQQRHVEKIHYCEELRQSTVQEIEEVRRIKENLEQLTRLSQELHYTQRNLLFPKKEMTKERRIALTKEIEDRFKELPLQDQNFQKFIFKDAFAGKTSGDLYTILNPPFRINQAASLFSRIARYTNYLEKRLEIIENRKLEIEGKLTIKEMEKLEEAEQEILKFMQGAFISLNKHILSFIECTLQTQHKIKTEMARLAQHFSHCSINIKFASERFVVKGYISVGELKIYKWIEDVIIKNGTIETQIKEMIKTAIDAFANPQNFEQLMLRLFVVDAI